MTRALRTRNLALLAVAAVFTVAFAIVVMPPLASRRNFDVIGALGDGFVNPFSAGYALDIFSTYTALAIWIIYEALAHKVRGGWIALVLGAVPGVAAGLVFYLIVRDRQLVTAPRPAD